MSREYHEAYRITGIKDEIKDVKTFILDNPMAVAPGSFVMVWLPGVSENPFSVSHHFPLSITVKRVGDETSFTSRLSSLHVGDRLWIRGPYGHTFPLPSSNNMHYLVAGGTGAIPLAFLSEHSNVGKEKLFAFLGAKNKDEILFEERFKRAIGEDRVLVSTEDGSYGYRGLVTDLFDCVNLKPNSRFYVCGPEKMMKFAAEKAVKYTDARNIYLSLERYMKCGRGLCGSCEVNGYRTCVDGPVFTYRQLSEGDFGRYSRTRSGMRREL